MRLGVVVDLDTVATGTAGDLVSRVEAAGLELVWLRSGSGRTSPMAVAASCAALADGLLVGVEAPVVDSHPLYLAEERNVVDQLLGGRLVVGLRASGRPVLDEEWVRVLLAAGGTTPFQHRGDHVEVPARLPQNVVNLEERVRVTPAPFNPEPTTWVLDAPGLAGRYGLSPVVGGERTPGEAQQDWDLLADHLGPLALRLRRPGVRVWDPAAHDAADLATDLVTERDLWGLDTVLVDLAVPAGSADWDLALADLGGVVRPRVQADALPAGLEDFWNDMRTQRQTTQRKVTS